MPYLLHMNQKGENKVEPFSNTITIGRSETNQIFLEDQRISRVHATIIQESNGYYYLIDENSKNGTFVNGSRITKYCLNDNITFHIERYPFTFINDHNVNNAKINIHEYNDQQTVCTPLFSPHDKFLKNEFVLTNQKMIELYDLVKDIAPATLPVLILGEPGTGKELIASLLHEYSNRKGNFIPVNCATMQKTTVESEMFGSKKGAFTGAVDKKGTLKEADKGTIFLDEIGDMDLEIQPKFLRFLETQSFVPVGSNIDQTSNARVISATNLNLDEMQQNKMFRKDFFDRISKIKLEIPPLRDRQDEIIPLANYFLDKYAKEFPIWKKPFLTQSAERALLSYHWPGNIRDLGNVISNVMVQVRGRPISKKDILMLIDNKKDNPLSTIQNVEKEQIIQALKVCNGNKVQASKYLGISRASIYRKIKEYQI